MNEINRDGADANAKVARSFSRTYLILPDARSQIVRKGVAASVARLDAEAEREALVWIEAVSEFDDDRDSAR